MKVGCVASGGRGGGSNTGTASGALIASSSTGSTEGMRSRNGCSAAGCAGVSRGRLVRRRQLGRRMLGPGCLDRRFRDGQRLGLRGRSSPRPMSARPLRPRGGVRHWFEGVRLVRDRLVYRGQLGRLLLRPRRLAPCLGDGCGGFFLCRSRLSAQLLGGRLLLWWLFCDELFDRGWFGWRLVGGSCGSSAGGSSRACATSCVGSASGVCATARVLGLHRLGGAGIDGRDEFGIGLRLGVRLDLRLPCQSSLHRRLPVGSFSHVCNRLAGVGRLIGQARCRQGQNAVRYVLDLRRQLIGRVGPGRPFYALVPQRFRGAGCPPAGAHRHLPPRHGRHLPCRPGPPPAPRLPRSVYLSRQPPEPLNNRCEYHAMPHRRTAADRYGGNMAFSQRLAQTAALVETRLAGLFDGMAAAARRLGCSRPCAMLRSAEASGSVPSC